MQNLRRVTQSYEDVDLFDHTHEMIELPRMKSKPLTKNSMIAGLPQRSKGKSYANLPYGFTSLESPVPKFTSHF